MVQIKLPDGSVREYEQAVTPATVAADIGPGLAKAALAARVDGQLVDTSFVIEADAELALITARDEDGLEVIRHSTAHLLAQAVKQLHPSAQVTIGPVIDDGFYYDFALEAPFTPEDLEAIEKRMRELADAAQPVTREVYERDQAVEYFLAQGEKYKAEIIEAIPAGEEIGLYGHGDFKDLCRGPHVPNTSHLKAFKLTKLAGAYWRGDSDNEMLQRVYGTAWGDKKALKAYLHQQEEAAKRDHRRFGKQQDLFHTQPEAPGMVFWHDKGWRLVRVLKDYMRERLREHKYQEVNTPQLVDRSLWERSGHWDKFGNNMFTTGSEDRQYAIKPMNCPCHVQIYNQGLHSHHELPLRMSEFGSCHRNEPSGTLHGLMRVRNFVQDDAHVFCTEEQIQSETARLIGLVFQVYKDFGFDDVIIALSTRPEERVGEDALWDRAESALEAALKDAGLDFVVQPGEGAFYGPKIEFSLRDCLNRVWQCGTVQLDFSMPERLGAEYVAADGSRQTPVMLHRAVLGSIERFVGILLEQYAGALPTWLSPVQAVVLTITDRQDAWAREVADSLKNQQFRVDADLRNEKVGFKIREHTLQKVPYLLVVGDREVESRCVAVRTRTGEDLGSMSLEAFTKHLAADVTARSY